MGRRQELDAALDDYDHVNMLVGLRMQSPLVPPSGPLDSPIVIVGEAPGKDEVTELAPFVGAAGRHLRFLLRKAGLDLSLLYVTNTVLYRPPGNRTPYPFEVMASEQRLMRELAIVQPRVVVSLGATAYRALVPVTDLSYRDARGHWLRLAYDAKCPEADLLVTWHPSAALRDRNADDELAAHLRLILRNGDDSSDRGPAHAGADGGRG